MSTHFTPCRLTGEKELLGLWISQTEGAKFWLGLLTELKNRGLQDIFIACVNIQLTIRNTERNNPPGLAMNHIEANKLVLADLTFDTSAASIAECVDEIIMELTAKMPEET